MSTNTNPTAGDPIGVTLFRMCKRTTRKDRNGKESERCDHGDRKCRWAIIRDFGYVLDAASGKRRRKQEWVTFRGSEEDARAERDKIAHQSRTQEYVTPKKVTFGEWLDTWLDVVAKPRLRPSSYESYRWAIDKHLKPALGAFQLQGLQPMHLTRYYTERRGILAASTINGHHTLINSALTSALKQGVVTRNVAKLAEGRGKTKKNERSADAKQHCWTAEEAQRVLAAADAAGPQLSAWFALALDTGARKGELLGLMWSDVVLDAATVTIERTLLAAGLEPRTGPTKTGDTRVLEIGPETAKRLAAHKRAQAELKMKNRLAYHDLGFVFAKEWGDVYGREDSLGLPLQINNFGEREFARVVKAAGVRRIKVHGTRHTTATLLLAAGEPVHEVSKRLGHSKPSMTLDIYAHAMPGAGRKAAATMGGLLFPTGTNL